MSQSVSPELLPVLPRHVAIIMDGNGRWAETKGLPRALGHRAGVKSVREAVQFCRQQGIEALTLFAFSSENWHRPSREVKLLMRLFSAVLKNEVKMLKDNDVRLKVIGHIEGFDDKLQARIRKAEADTAHCNGMVLNVAANYGGRWDIVNAARNLAQQVQDGVLEPAQIDESRVDAQTCLTELADVDLLIRTGGEKRISNFLLWQCAYSELHFCETLWPDFNKEAFQKAVDDFVCRQRRFGKTSAQVEANPPITPEVPEASLQPD